MSEIVGNNLRIWIAALITAFICCLATTARADKYDYDSAMRKAQTEINSKDYLQAFSTIKEIGHNAFKNDNAYGKYLFYSATANLYHDQGDYVKAETLYRKAIEAANSDLPTVDLSENYYYMARCLDKLTRRSEGVELLEKGLKNVKTTNGKARMYIQLCKMLYWEKRYGDYISYYHKAKQYFGKEISTDMAAYMTAIKEIIEGNTDKAEKTAMSINNLDDRYAALREVYVATGDYRRAYPIFKARAHILEANTLDEGMSYHIAEMDAGIIKSKLNLTRVKLEYEMAQQKLKMNKEQDLLNDSRNENTKIRLANDSQLIAKMRADSLVRSTEAEEREAQYQMLMAMGERHRITMIFSIVIFVLVFIYGVFAWISNRLVIISLKKKQLLLSQALDKAQEAERVKTAFIENLGYKVATPTNKVIGMVENAMARIDTMSKEEKKHIDKEISHTADGLTAMLNNVLKNSLAESGGKLSKVIITIITIGAMMMPKESSAQPVDEQLDRIYECINNKQLLTAQQLAVELVDETQERKDRMRQFKAMEALGEVQKARRFYKNAIQVYLDAYVIYLKNQLNGNPTALLINLSNMYRKEGEYDDAAHYLNEAKRQYKTPHDEYLVNIYKARLAFEKNDKSEFFRLYAEIIKIKAEKGFNCAEEEYILNIMNMLYEGKREKAISMAKTKLSDEQYLRIKELDCAHNGEWKKACELFQKEVVLHRQKMKEVFEADREEMNDIAGNNILETKNMQMKLASANLRIEQLRQQNELGISQQARHKLMIDNNALVINRMKAEQRLAKAIDSRKEAVLGMQQEKSELGRRISILTFIFALLLVALLSSYLWHTHKSKKRLREKNDELNAAISKAQESEKLKSTFIQNMSHEIRTPLNAIVGFSKLMLDEANELDNKEKEDFVDIIRRNEEMLKQLIDDVMSLHDLHSGNYKMKYCPHAVNNICRMSIETVKHKANPNVPILFTTNIDNGFEIITDGMRVAQVIINFLTNAIKYTEEGNITLDCSYDHPKNILTFSVTDTGCGIPKDKQQEIFERFAKLDSFHQGTGLGLNICHVISQRLGGKVGIDPEYEDGSRFYLTLPIK